MIDVRVDGWRKFAYLDHHTVHAGIGPADLGDPGREPFEQLIVLGRDDGSDRLADRSVVVLDRRKRYTRGMSAATHAGCLQPPSCSP